MDPEQKQMTTGLDIELPHSLVPCLVDLVAGETGNYHATTKRGTVLELEVKKVDEAVRLRMLGPDGFLQKVQHTYFCHIAAITAISEQSTLSKLSTNDAHYHMVHSAASESCPNTLETCDIQDPAESDSPDTIMNSKQSETQKIKTEEEDPGSDNDSKFRRSSRIKRKYGGESIVQRLNLAKKIRKVNEHCPQNDLSVESSLSKSSPYSFSPNTAHAVVEVQNKSESIPDSITDDSLVHDQDTIYDAESVTNYCVSDIAGDASEDEVPMTVQASTAAGHETLETNLDIIDEGKITGKESVDSEPGYFLSLQSKHMLSEEERELVQNFALRCALCRYAAVHRSTFKSHIKLKHGISWKEYLENHGKPMTVAETLGKAGSEEHEDVDFVKPEPTEVFKRKTRTKSTKPKPESVIVKIEDPNDAVANEYCCELCGNNYSSQPALLFHLRSKHEDDPCSKDITKNIRDKGSSVNKSGIVIQCEVCSKTFIGERIFSHMTLKHIKEDDFQDKYQKIKKTYHRELYQLKSKDKMNAMSRCPHCDGEMKTCSLTRHVKFHCKKNANTKRRFDCSLCSFFAYNADDFAQHKKTAHTDRPKYICETCGAIYDTSVGLRQHMRIKHGAVWKKAFNWLKCSECGKLCQNKHVLARHLVVHKPEYRYSCDICGKRYIDKSSVITHQRTFHDHNYRFHCPVCGHGVEKEKQLETHKCTIIQQSKDSIEDIPPVNILEPATDQETTPDLPTSELSIESELVPEDYKVALSGEEQDVSVAMVPTGDHYMAVDSDVVTVKSEIDPDVILQSEELSSVLGEESIMVVMESGELDSAVGQHTLVNTMDLEDGSTLIFLPGNSEEGLEENEMYAVMQTAAQFIQ